MPMSTKARSGSPTLNVELKARAEDLDTVRDAALELGAKPDGVFEQTDTFFETQAGLLKLRVTDSEAQLIPYLRAQKADAKRSDYALLPVEDPEHTKKLLTSLLGSWAEVRKRREVLLLGNVRIHLDEVEGLGAFVELEAVQTGRRVAKTEHGRLRDLIRKLGVGLDQMVSCSYAELLSGRGESPTDRGQALRVLGVDPGTQRTGYGVVDKCGGRLTPIDYGVIRAKRSLPFAERLHRMFVGIQDVIAKHRPDCVAVEEAFYGKSVSVAIKIGEGRGVALLAAAAAGVEVAEYQPRLVKRSVVGHGGAHKTQVQEMVRVVLGLEEIPKPDDAADALALAICHCHRTELKARRS